MADQQHPLVAAVTVGDHNLRGKVGKGGPDERHLSSICRPADGTHMSSRIASACHREMTRASTPVSGCRRSRASQNRCRSVGGERHREDLSARSLRDQFARAVCLCLPDPQAGVQAVAAVLLRIRHVLPVWGDRREHSVPDERELLRSRTPGPCPGARPAYRCRRPLKSAAPRARQALRDDAASARGPAHWSTHRASDALQIGSDVRCALIAKLRIFLERPHDHRRALPVLRGQPPRRSRNLAQDRRERLQLMSCR